MPFKNPHPLYQVWRSMRDRCRNPNNRQWADYGARGIAICDRWDSFSVFAEDMGDRPPGYSLDRIDNDLGYSPENCRWADRKTQQRNQRRAVFVSIEGERYRAIDLAQQTGMKTDTIVERARKGLSLGEVLRKEKRHNLAGLKLGGKANGRKKLAQTHCKAGHEFTPANTLLTPEGWRRCIACKNARQRDYVRRMADKA